jgi:uncharacterized protein YndB with AHSA1/START domain
MKAEPVIKDVIVHAPVSKVWKALTDKNEMKNWYFEIKKFKPEVGFEFQFYGGSDEKKYLHLCGIKEVIPNKKLSYSWRYENYKGESIVTFDLLPEGNKTKIKLTHEGLESFPNDNPDFARKNFVEGWNQIIGTSLKEYVEKKQDFIAKAEISINKPPSKIWKALTKPEIIKQYLFGTEVTTDWKIGSLITYKGVWKGKSYEDKGRILQVEPKKLLVSTYWSSLAGLLDIPENYKTVSYKLSSQDNKTKLTVTQDNNTSQDEANHSEHNWNEVLNKLKELLEK